jgi:hypothetical protein
MKVGGIGNCWYTMYIAAHFLEDEDFAPDEDPRVAAAEEHDLDWYIVQPRSTVDDHDVDESKRILLIGTRLALIGDGGEDAAHLPGEELLQVIEETGQRLRLAGIEQWPKLWTHCDIDLGD